MTLSIVATELVALARWVTTARLFAIATARPLAHVAVSIPVTILTTGRLTFAIFSTDHAHGTFSTPARVYELALAIGIADFIVLAI